MMPKRIQRKRTRGWKMPDGTKYVGRPGKYGNPFKLIGDIIYCDASHRRKLLDPWVVFGHDNLYSQEDGQKKIVKLYEQWIHGTLSPWNYENHGVVRPPKFTVSDVKNELGGLDLACFCPKSFDCHVDVLLKISNS